MTAGATIDPSRAVLGLTPQQWAFCEAYVANGGNGTQAALSAGYGASSAHVRASKLLGKEKVQQALALIAVPAVAKAADDLGKKAAALEIREDAVTAREEAVAETETLEQMRDRVRGQIIETLCGMGFTRMDQLARWSERGVEFIPSAELTQAALEAIESVESESRELELAEGTRLAVDVKLKIKRHARLPVLKELARLLELGPAPSPRGKDGREASQGPAVLVVVAGGKTGLELGAAQLAIAVTPGGIGAPGEPVTARVLSPGGSAAESARMQTPGANPQPATAKGATGHIGAGSRPWNPSASPRPKKNASTSPPPRSRS